MKRLLSYLSYGDGRITVVGSSFLAVLAFDLAAPASRVELMEPRRRCGSSVMLFKSNNLYTVNDNRKQDIKRSVFNSIVNSLLVKVLECV